MRRLFSSPAWLPCLALILNFKNMECIHLLGKPTSTLGSQRVFKGMAPSSPTTIQGSHLEVPFSIRLPLQIVTLPSSHHSFMCFCLLILYTIMPFHAILASHINHCHSILIVFPSSDPSFSWLIVENQKLALFFLINLTAYGTSIPHFWPSSSVHDSPKAWWYLKHFFTRHLIQPSQWYRE